ncbi:MAG: CAP domain-containing protein [Solirubrobacterales bacterium]|nr:CAP domain-containing protein [Solirubrobacterales bacterium]
MLLRTVIACAVIAITGAVPRAAAAAEIAGGCAGANVVAVDNPTRAQATRTVLCLVNRQRARQGRKPLRASAQLADAATGHSDEMVARRYFSHSSPEGGGVRSRARLAGYIRKGRFAFVDETIAWGSGRLATPAKLVTTFMRSAAHRRALLDKRLRDLGVGLTLGAPEAGAKGPATTLTLDFGRR